MANTNQKFAKQALKYVGQGATKFRTWFYGSDQRNVPWCAIFVSYVAQAIGILNKIVKKCDGAGDFPRLGVKADWGEWYEGDIAKPIVGDIILFTWNGQGHYEGHDAYFSDHVGVVYAVDDNFVYTVEGNTNGSNDNSVVSKRRYALYSGYINGYYRPDWSKIDGIMPTDKPAVTTKSSGYLRDNNWYDDQGGTSRIICSVPKNAEIEWLSDDIYGWSKVKYKNKTGYIQNSRISKKDISTWRTATLKVSRKCNKVKDAKTKRKFKKGEVASLISIIETGSYAGLSIINYGGVDYYVGTNQIVIGGKRVK